MKDWSERRALILGFGIWLARSLRMMAKSLIYIHGGQNMGVGGEGLWPTTR